MTNLYEETTNKLARYEKTWADVRCLLVGRVALHPMFASRVLNFDYYSGFGVEYVNLDLKVVGDDWWLERAEYDGSEWWEFKTMPELPEQFCEDEQEFAKLLRA